MEYKIKKEREEIVMKRRVVAMLMATVMAAATVLAGCGDSKDQGASNDSQNQDADNGQGETGGEDTDGETGGGTVGEDGDVTVITYAGWEDAVMIREMADRFNQLHPDIRVEIAKDGSDWTGNEQLTEMAATGQMPDIINLENITVPYQNGWVIDLKSYMDADPDAASLPANLVKYGTVGDEVIMLPGAMYFYGIMVNKDLLTANGIAIPEYNWTVDEFKDIVKKTTKPGSMVGTTEVLALIKHIPPQLNPALGWGSFNEETKEYELGTEFEAAVAVAKEIIDADACIYEKLDALGQPWDYEEGSTERQEVDEARANFLMERFGESDSFVAWLKGKIATYLDFAWSMSFPSNADYSGFDWDFYPIPGDGTSPCRPPFVVDSIGITSTCENPEAAYEFVKFLSFSKEGIEARMDIVENQDMDALKAKYPELSEDKFQNPLNFSQMPVTTDQEIIDRWAEFNNVKPGIKYMLENLENGYADGYKVTPGFDDAYHKNIQVTIRDEVLLSGQKSFLDVADELEQKANEITKEAYSVLGQ